VSTSLGVETRRSTQRGQAKPGRAPTRAEVDEGVRQELSRLPTLERGALQVLWAELFGVPPNPRLRRELLVLILTYRIQEKAYGGLKPSTRKKLLSYAEGFAKDKEVVSVQARVTKPGTKIVREWGNKLHEVVVADSGFNYNGRQYRSLSEIAREITGTRWSGPAFFGLKKRAKGVAA
jgi:Protein of unknown function (DUF2924)